MVFFLNSVGFETLCYWGKASTRDQEKFLGCIDQVKQGVFDVRGVAYVAYMTGICYHLAGLPLEYQLLAYRAFRCGIVHTNFVKRFARTVKIYTTDFPGSAGPTLGEQLQQLFEGLGAGHGREGKNE